MDKKTIITLAAGLIIVVLWLALFSAPLNKDIKILKVRMSELERKEKEIISNAVLAATQDQVDTLESQLAYKIKRIYTQERLLDLGREVEIIGKKYGIRLNKITPNFQALTDLIEGDKIASLPVTIEFAGQFGQFTKFLDDLNILDFNIRINEIEIAKDEKKGNQINFILQGDIALKKREVDNKPVQNTRKIDQA